MAAVLAPTPSLFTLSRTKLSVFFSLILTWWLAFKLPHYEPAIKETLRVRLDEARQKIPTVKIDWMNNRDPRHAYSPSKVALMIEPRPLPHLVPQMLHMMSVVPPDWRFLFIGSEQSTVSAGRAYSIKYQQAIGKLDLMVLPEPWNISSKEHIDRTLTDLRFYDEFLPGVKWLLKFESDSILCANSATGLEDWLDFDWVGAPRGWNDATSGGGGLTLRRVSIIRRILSFQARYNDTEPEHEWFGKRVTLLPGAKVAADREKALAVENVYVPDAMGYHFPGQSLTSPVWGVRKRRMAMFGYCPEVTMLLNMKLERERCLGDTDNEQITSTTAFEERRKKFLKKLKQQQEEEKARLKAGAGAAGNSPSEGVAEAAQTGVQATDGSTRGHGLAHHEGHSTRRRV